MKTRFSLSRFSGVSGIALSVLLSFNLAAATVDLEKTMKEMAFQYKKAHEATTIVQLTPHIENLKLLTQTSLTAEFPEDKADKFKQGLELVLQELTAAEHALDAQNLSAAKQHLKAVDKLRKQYHKHRKVSIWQLLFG
ncbi:cytochrome b562 [Rheinheimera sp. WS51]|uniref:cytochrome b562 n=1 Tax=Rheinheimera sp. WS51 TaxID=3425886 RepID=UPI003D8EA51B